MKVNIKKLLFLLLLVTLIYVPVSASFANNTPLGQWSEFDTKLKAEEKKVFNEAMQGLMGVSYQPVAVAKQVVQGTNYRFFCNSKAIYPNAVNKAALVEIYQSLEGSVHIKEIKIIE